MSQRKRKGIFALKEEYEMATAYLRIYRNIESWVEERI